MKRILAGLLLSGVAGLVSFEAQSATVQWATGCTSLERPDVLSVSYDTVFREITLYQARISSRAHDVTRYVADALSPEPFRQPTIFKAYLIDGTIELPVIFESKATLYLIDGSRRIRYYCAYYSFDRS